MVYGGFAPFEIREVVEFGDDIIFGGTEIPAGTTVQSRYVAYDYRFGYSYAFVNHPRVRLGIGAALALFDTEVAMVTESMDTTIGKTLVRPPVTIGAEFVFGKRWLAFADFFWWSDSELELGDFTAQVGYSVTPNWLVSAGYRWVDRRVELDELYSDTIREQVALGITYMW
jgi:hypothetical protein